MTCANCGTIQAQSDACIKCGWSFKTPLLLDHREKQVAEVTFQAAAALYELSGILQSHENPDALSLWPGFASLTDAQREPWMHDAAVVAKDHRVEMRAGG